MVRQEGACLPGSALLKASNSNPNFMELAVKRGNLNPGKKGLGIERKNAYFKARVILAKSCELITFMVAIQVVSNDIRL